jgi:hypothetical protein
MSGGAYNYLYSHVRQGGLGGYLEELGEMRARLEASGYEAPARATREVIRALNGAERMAGALERVWHAVEWCDSGDYGEDEVRAAVAAFEPWPPP